MIQIALFLGGLATVLLGVIGAASTESSLAALSDALGIMVVSNGASGPVLWVGGWLMIGLSGVIGVVWRAVNILTKVEEKLSELPTVRNHVAAIDRRLVQESGAAVPETAATRTADIAAEHERIAAIQAKYDIR